MAASALHENEFKDLWNYNLAVDPVLGQSSPYDLDETFTADPFNLKFDALGFEGSDDFPLIFHRPVDEMGMEAEAETEGDVQIHPETGTATGGVYHSGGPVVLPDCDSTSAASIEPPKPKKGAKRSNVKAKSKVGSASNRGANAKSKSKLKLKTKKGKKGNTLKPDQQPHTPLLQSVFEHTNLSPVPVPSSRPATSKGRKRSNSNNLSKNKGLLVSKRWKSEDWDSKPGDKSFIMANNRIKWSQSEIRTLWRMIAVHGNEWRQVQKPLKGRTYHQVKDKGRRLLQQQLWKTGRTKVVADGAHKTAKTIALQVLKKYEE